MDLRTAGIEAAITHADPIKAKLTAFSAQFMWVWGSLTTLGACTRNWNTMNIAASNIVAGRA